jgi:2-oxoglutarate/2-oxoacid ferredoxin oxidoreductase subunit alpha
MRSLLILELGIDPSKFRSVLNYDGMPITADRIVDGILHDHPQPTTAS